MRFSCTFSVCYAKILTVMEYKISEYVKRTKRKTEQLIKELENKD